MPQTPPVIVTFTLDCSELARRGRKGATVTNAAHNGKELTSAARKTFDQKFPDAAARSAFFADLGRRSAAARRARKDGVA